MEENTIVAIATPPGIGALSIIRMSGCDAYKIFNKSIKDKKSIKNRFAHNFFIIDKNNHVIDEVIAIHYKAPKTFTGEDLVEIICHGGNVISKKILELLINNGARIAQRGEFTFRAFKNGKIELLKAESINALIESKSEKEHKIAIENYQGKFKKIKEWENALKKEEMYLEAEIEFGEEENLKERKNDKIKEIKSDIEYYLEIDKYVKEKKHKSNVTIIGPSNAGKSSLFNKIIKKNKAIINDKPGTTRDIVTETVEINKIEIEINDTAGIRSTKETVEIEGIKKSKEIINESEILLWVTDISKKINDDEKSLVEKIDKKKTIFVLNKCDLKINKEKEKYYKEYNYIEVSVKKDINILNVIKKIKRRIKEIEKNKIFNELLITKRQIQIAEETVKMLKNVIESWKQKEIAAFYLKETISVIEKMFGKNSIEETMNTIFDNFCIGK